MVLTEEERREIQTELRHNQPKQAVAIDAMKIVQRLRGWLSDEDLGEVGELLGMAPAELDSVATFYNLLFRRPVGRHLILVCNSVSCWITGYDRMLEHLTARLGIGLGETDADGRFTLLPIVCLGACDRAPAMMVDDELYGDLTPERIDEILERHQ